jgi:pyrroloquinoline quinone biosynthesis protein D
VITKLARPRLASKVRLRFDRHTRRHMLVYPDKGMVLTNTSAEAIAQLCTGEHTVEAIVERLHAAAGGATREEVERGVHEFLDALLERALIKLE